MPQPLALTLTPALSPAFGAALDYAGVGFFAATGAVAAGRARLVLAARGVIIAAHAGSFPNIARASPAVTTEPVMMMPEPDWTSASSASSTAWA